MPSQNQNSISDGMSDMVAMAMPRPNSESVKITFQFISGVIKKNVIIQSYPNQRTCHRRKSGATDNNHA